MSSLKRNFFTAGLILLIFQFTGTMAQNRVHGRITDAATGEPIAFANVFFVNTTIGVTSDQDGKYHLKFFELDTRAGIMNYYGLPQFELLKPKNKSQEKKWARNRRDIYYGSMLHFMRSWYGQRWKDDGFKVSRLYRIPNRNRPSDDLLAKKIAVFRTEVYGGGKTVIRSKDFRTPAADSLSYYLNLQRLPVAVDSVLEEVLGGAEFTAGTDKALKNFTGWLRVTYNEKEDPDYAASVGRPGKITLQRSNLHFGKPITVYTNGYFEDVREVFSELYWSWSEKVSALLPLDYQPVN